MMQMDLDLNTLMQKAYEIRRQFPIGSREWMGNICLSVQKEL